MYKICTSIDQSKKLIELGIDVKTADMFWSLNPEVLVASEYMTEDNCIPCVDAIPAWSLTALMNILPSEITERDEYSETTYQIDIRKYALTDDVDIYQIAYGNYHWTHGGHSWSDMVDTGEKEELIDAAFQMICWLLENNKI